MVKKICVFSEGVSNIEGIFHDVIIVKYDIVQQDLQLELNLS